MKVLFIVPPDTMWIESSTPDSLSKKREFRQRVGLLSVAAYAMKHAGIDAHYLDYSMETDLASYSQLLEDVKRINPDIIGLSALTFNLLDCRKAAQTVKSALPHIKIAIGGHHCTIYPNETINFPEMDYLICGEAERPFTTLINVLKQGGDPEALDKINGLAWKDTTGRVHFNVVRDFVENLDELPMPAHGLVDLSKYSHVLAEGDQVASIQTSRGCPAGCTFCDIRRTKFRGRSAECVLEELRTLYRLGVKEFFVVDDTFTVNKKRVFAICQQIIDEGLDIQYKISSRCDMVTPELLEMLHKSGCYRIHYGVETASPRLLKELEKGSNHAVMETAFKWTRQAGIQTLAYMMIGIPTETHQEMKASMKYPAKLGADYVQFSICTPYPKTELYHRALQGGWIPYDYWTEFANDPQPGFKVKFWNPHFTESQLREIQNEAMRKFYWRPSFIAREFTKVKSRKQLTARVKMAMKLLLPTLGRSGKGSVPVVQQNHSPA